jgi:hypothetical protein
MGLKAVFAHGRGLPMAGTNIMIIHPTLLLYSIIHEPSSLNSTKGIHLSCHLLSIEQVHVVIIVALEGVTLTLLKA